MCIINLDSLNNYVGKHKLFGLSFSFSLREREKARVVFTRAGAAPSPKPEREEYLECKSRALALVEARAGYFAEQYGFSFGRISIRCQKTRWGSCSKKGNLNFNYKIIRLPADLADYIIVHELCHLKELNHGKRFWELVARILPGYPELRRRLRKESL